MYRPYEPEPQIQQKSRGSRLSEAAYVGSREEKEELIDLYIRHNGSLKQIRRKLRFSRRRGRADTPRLLEILEKAAGEGRLELLDMHKTRIENRRLRDLYVGNVVKSG
ncbi:hypothetical protein QBC34DRAFT_411705 [Podospora aff. communis PSN243]|uniref:DNAJC9 HTH domain-containing protein n=1 Tax=Podospora aff. communis PSN243 TaxID=3040156 RepID=A0AAV9GES1_9PEZI|nr:hypothetical protein QBC34DRAFT_411705 [Podospora aff. communis PSN243]